MTNTNQHETANDTYRILDKKIDQTREELVRWITKIDETAENLREWQRANPQCPSPGKCDVIERSYSFILTASEKLEKRVSDIEEWKIVSDKAQYKILLKLSLVAASLVTLLTLFAPAIRKLLHLE